MWGKAHLPGDSPVLEKLRSSSLVTQWRNWRVTLCYHHENTMYWVLYLHFLTTLKDSTEIAKQIKIVL